MLLTITLKRVRVKLVTKLQHLEVSADLLITFQDLPTIERQISKALRLNIEARNDNILQYIRERIASSERLRRLKRHIHIESALCNPVSTTVEHQTSH